MAVKRPDSVGPHSVVVEIDVPDHGRDVGREVPGDAICIGRADDEEAEATSSGECGDAERKARSVIGVLSHRVRDLPRF